MFDFSKEELSTLGYFGSLTPSFPEWTWGKTFVYKGKMMPGNICSTTKDRWGELHYSTHQGEVYAWEDSEGNLFNASGYKPELGNTVNIPSLEEFQQDILAKLYKKHECSSVEELQVSLKSLQAARAEEIQADRKRQAQEQADRETRMEQLSVLVEQLNQIVAPHGYAIRYHESEVWVKTQTIGYDFRAHIWEPQLFEKGVEALKTWVDSLPPLLKTGKVPPKKRAK